MLPRRCLFVALLLAILAITNATPVGSQGLKKGPIAPKLTVDVFHGTLSQDPLSTLNPGVTEVRRLLTPVLASLKDPADAANEVRLALVQAYPGLVTESTEPTVYKYYFNGDIGAWVRVCCVVKTFAVSHDEGLIIAGVGLGVPF